MTNILAIDTSTPACSAALLCGDNQISRHQLGSREHTRLILPMVDEVLSEAGLVLSQIDALAFTAGPGSFTGIRIGFGVVQGLAFGADIPVLPVSTLEALAHTAIRKLNISAQTYVLPMLDARMDEVYWSLFEYNGAELNRVHGDNLTPPEDITSLFSGAAHAVVGDGWNYADRILLKPAVFDSTLLPEARDVLSIALREVKAGKTCSIDQVQPVYLRNNITWKKRQRLRQVT
ncbi:MAG: tRNA (adenosine(37)-N6)-threonylcarbamoyltransferase complex dimerization subunit type 1 TsaB [Porticoccus sp.]